MEHLDTIPVWDALRLNGECLFCALTRQLEAQQTERFLGASVMEPDVRVRVNEKGFCARHQAMLYARQNRLGHALMLHTHLGETRRRLEPALARLERPAPGGLGRGKRAQDAAREAADTLEALTSTCLMCQEVDAHMKRYLHTFFHLYRQDQAFCQAFTQGKGVCLPHGAALLRSAPGELHGRDLEAFLAQLARLLRGSLERTDRDLEWFTLKFDYRNADKPWGDSRDAVERTANKLRGLCVESGENQP